jgi:hypothetical protein
VNLQTYAFEDGGLDNLCITIGVIQPEDDMWFISTENYLGRCWPSLAAMKNIYEVLREKEMDLARLRTEVDALRFVAPLLAGRIAEPGDDNVVRQPDLTWTPALQKNKWPLKVGTPAPTYSDS